MRGAATNAVAAAVGFVGTVWVCGECRWARRVACPPPAGASCASAGKWHVDNVATPPSSPERTQDSHEKRAGPVGASHATAAVRKDQTDGYSDGGYSDGMCETSAQHDSDEALDELDDVAAPLNHSATLSVRQVEGTNVEQTEGPRVVKVAQTLLQRDDMGMEHREMPPGAKDAERNTICGMIEPEQGDHESAQAMTKARCADDGGSCLSDRSPIQQDAREKRAGPVGASHATVAVRKDQTDGYSDGMCETSAQHDSDEALDELDDVAAPLNHSATLSVRQVEGTNVEQTEGPRVVKVAQTLLQRDDMGMEHREMPPGAKDAERNTICGMIEPEQGDHESAQAMTKARCADDGGSCLSDRSPTSRDSAPPQPPKFGRLAGVRRMFEEGTTISAPDIRIREPVMDDNMRRAASLTVAFTQLREELTSVEADGVSQVDCLVDDFAGPGGLAAAVDRTIAVDEARSRPSSACSSASDTIYTECIDDGRPHGAPVEFVSHRLGVGVAAPVVHRA